MQINIDAAKELECVYDCEHVYQFNVTWDTRYETVEECDQHVFRLVKQLQHIKSNILDELELIE